MLLKKKKGLPRRRRARKRNPLVIKVDVEEKVLSAKKFIHWQNAISHIAKTPTPTPMKVPENAHMSKRESSQQDNRKSISYMPSSIFAFCFL